MDTGTVEHLYGVTNPACGSSVSPRHRKPSRPLPQSSTRRSPRRFNEWDPFEKRVKKPPRKGVGVYRITG